MRSVFTPAVYIFTANEGVTKQYGLQRSIHPGTSLVDERFLLGVSADRDDGIDKLAGLRR